MDRIEQMRQRQLELIADRERVYQINAELSKDLAGAQQQIQALNSELARVKAELVNERELRLNLERARAKLSRPLRSWAALFRKSTNS